ncbi:MAG: HD-GYP domain-containing protein [Longimicrobiales bacterium]|nr:HD-GYP domain-containing protein [Longimicrobiales bacterium]
MNHPVKAFVTLVAVAAIAVVVTADWWGLLVLPISSMQGLAVMVVLGVVAERLTVVTSIGKSGSTQTVAYLPLLTTVLLFGPQAGLLFVLLTHVVGSFLFRRNPSIKNVFNISQHTVAGGLAGFVFHELGGIAAARDGLGVPGSVEYTWTPLLAYGFVYLSVNYGLVSKVVAMDTTTPFYEVWRQVVGRSGGHFVYDILVSPVAVAIAATGMEIGVVGLVLASLPLLAIRNAYAGRYRLQQTNEDLLNALVKAIETRDPYTSGHSLRVANLSRRVAIELGLPGRMVEEVEQSALLHDVGKIDAVYTEILRKPESLTDHEREVIESHVLKGVAILETMSSVPDAVITNVRYHHERWDGRGYPERLSGHDIPIGGRIIAICDAVDAMLSDRPYRRALDVPTVRAELERYAGVQFDPKIAATLIEANLVESYVTPTPDDAVDRSGRSGSAEPLHKLGESSIAK